MHTIRINNPEIEQYIKSVYGDNDSNLMKDFLSFIKTEMISNDIKKGFEEVKKFENNEIILNDVEDFSSELKNENKND